MLLLSFAANTLSIPNPNIVLMSGLVVCASLFGFPGGVAGGIVMFVYTLAFFSTGHDFVTFTDQNMQKVIVSAIGIVVVTVFVSTLRQFVTRAFSQLEKLNEQLEEDNRLLEEATAVDALTGTHNRFGLRRDFPHFVGQSLSVMMLDIDDFKQINDTCGHQAGDRILAEVSKQLMSLFGKENVYRYGGDEFLIVSPGLDEETFIHNINTFGELTKSIVIDGDDVVRFSAGYVHGTPEQQSELRMMIRQADSNLYASKNAGKNRITGNVFSHE